MKEEESKMTKQKLDEITSRVTAIFSKAEFYDCVWCARDDPAYCLDCEKNDTVYNLINIIASLHNELYKEVTGKYYDYMFHWANLGYGGSPDDSMFKDKEDAETNEALENMINSLRAVQSIKCPCVGCKRTESDYCGLRAYCEYFRKWKEAEDGIHSEGEA